MFRNFKVVERSDCFVTGEVPLRPTSKRTEEIITTVDEIKKRQEDDFRYLVQKIDTDIGNVRTELGQFRGEVKNDLNQLRSEVKSDLNQLRTEVKNDISQLRAEVKNDISQLRAEVKADIGQLRGEIGQLNQRFDTVIQLLVSTKPPAKG